MYISVKTFPLTTLDVLSSRWRAVVNKSCRESNTISHNYFHCSASTDAASVTQSSWRSQRDTVIVTQPAWHRHRDAASVTQPAWRCQHWRTFCWRYFCLCCPFLITSQSIVAYACCIRDDVAVFIVCSRLGNPTLSMIFSNMLTEYLVRRQRACSKQLWIRLECVTRLDWEKGEDGHRESCDPRRVNGGMSAEVPKRLTHFTADKLLKQ